MAKPIEADYRETWLLPPSLEDLVPRDHPARFLREFVDALDLTGLGFAEQRAEDGRPPYANSLLLKVWLYGYWNGIRSPRKLERACHEHLSLLWLTGLHYPDHNTLWRFWNANRKVLRGLHRQSVQVAMKAGLVSLVLLAVDGTKIEAVASRHSGWSKEYMQKVLQQLEAVLDRTEQEIEQNGQREQGQYRLPASLADKQALREAVAKGLAELAQSGRKHYHRHEPQAHRMQCSGANRFAYNGQAVADEKAGIIVGCDVTDQENDVGELAPRLEQARQTVREAQAKLAAPGAAAGPVAAEPPAEEPTPAPSASLEPALAAVADTGYGAAADIAAAQAAGFDVVVPAPEGKPKKNQPYHTAHFQYDPQRDVCVCPRGQLLAFERQKNRRGTRVRVYRCRCQDCPVRAACTRDKRGRMIEIGPHHQEAVAMRAKLASEAGQARFKQRARIIEPRFAAVKVRQGFRRWTVRGLEKVKVQWQWVCLTANLQVLFKRWLSGGLQLG